MMHSIYEHPVLGKSSEVSDTGVAAYMLPLFPDVSYSVFVATCLCCCKQLYAMEINYLLLGAFAKLGKATISFAMSRLPSV